jgi:hypothetical protein
MMLETDPVTLALVGDDIVFVNGRSSLAAGLDAAVIGATARMRLVYGEWILNRNVGVRWFENDLVPAAQAILGQRFNAIRLRSEMRRAILATPAAIEILRLDVTFDVATRAATVVWRARFEFGDTDLNVLEVS